MKTYSKSTAVGLAFVAGVVPWLTGCSSNEMRCGELLEDFRKFRDFGDTEGRYDAMRDQVLEAESIECDMGQFVWF